MRPRKTDIEGVDVTCWDRLFQVWAAATGKARSLMVDSRVRRTFNDRASAGFGLINVQNTSL